MSDIRIVIKILCDHLNLLLKVNLKPDNFRLAKFDNNDEGTINELWTTLYQLCFALGPTGCKQDKDSLQQWVQLQMAFKGYSSIEFYCLPCDKSCGSRELLLALTWLIAQEDALSELTRECVQISPLSYEYSNEAEREILGATGKQNSIHSAALQSSSSLDGLNYALWLATRIRYNLNQVLDAEQERVKNTHLVHKASSGSSGLPHLSVMETKLVRDPGLLEKTMPQLLKLTELIDIHTKWLKNRAVFWEWMDSVIELKKAKRNGELVLQPQQERALAFFKEKIQVNSKEPTCCGPSKDPQSSQNIPRFILSSSLAKSASSLVRKASSSDLLTDVGRGDNGVVNHASEWLARVACELQDAEKLRNNKLQELNAVLQTVTRHFGVVVINDNTVSETESEDCSK